LRCCGPTRTATIRVRQRRNEPNPPGPGDRDRTRGKAGTRSRTSTSSRKERCSRCNRASSDCSSVVGPGRSSWSISACFTPGAHVGLGQIEVPVHVADAAIAAPGRLDELRFELRRERATGRGFFLSIVSILNIHSCAVRLMLDVRQSGGSPRRTSKTGTGSANPLRSRSPLESNSKRFPTQSSRMAVETAMPPGEATPHRRADI
jgi:hypothetical protein